MILKNASKYAGINGNSCAGTLTTNEIMTNSWRDSALGFGSGDSGQSKGVGLMFAHHNPRERNSLKTLTEH